MRAVTLFRSHRPCARGPAHYGLPSTFGYPREQIGQTLAAIRHRLAAEGAEIVCWIAEAHGGCIEVQSTVGQGSTFTVVLAPLNRSLTRP